MKKTSNSEPRPKNPRISGDVSRKSGSGDRGLGRSYRKSGDDSTDFKRRSPVAERVPGAFGNDLNRKNHVPRSQDREPGETDSKPRRSVGGPRKVAGGSRTRNLRTKRTDGGIDAPVKQSREYKKDFRKPDNDFRAKDSGENTRSSGPWKTEGGSRTPYIRTRKAEGDADEYSNKPREYKKDFRKTDNDFRTKNNGQNTRSSEPWKKDSRPARSDSGQWKPEGGSRAPFNRNRKPDGDTGASGNKSWGYKKDFRTGKGDARKTVNDSRPAEQIASKKSDRQSKVFGVPWKPDSKLRGAKTKPSVFGKGPGIAAYTRGRKASNGPYKKKFGQ